MNCAFSSLILEVSRIAIFMIPVVTFDIKNKNRPIHFELNTDAYRYMYINIRSCLSFFSFAILLQTNEMSNVNIVMITKQNKDTVVYK